MLSVSCIIPAAEMSIDTTAFGSVYTLAREAGAEILVRRTTAREKRKRP